MPAISNCHKIDIDSLISSGQPIFNPINRVILSTEQKSEPLGDVRNKKIAVTIDPNMAVLISYNYASGRPDQLYYVMEDASHEVNVTVTPNAFETAISESFYSNPRDNVFSSDDTSGFYQLTINMIRVQQLDIKFNIEEIIAYEEAYIKTQFIYPNDVGPCAGDYVQTQNIQLFNSQDYRAKRLILNASLNYNYIETQQNFTISYTLQIVNGDTINDYFYNDIRDAITAYNNTNIRPDPE